MTDLQTVISDLTAEGDDVDRLVAGLDASGWKTPTPAPGWTIAHQIAHLTTIFRMAAMSAAEPKEFEVMLARLSDDFSANVRAAMEPYLAGPPQELLGRWRAERAAASKALAAVPPDRVVPWLVRPLPPAILACAGIMELFGHGQDIADALGVRLERTDRIMHLAGFAVLVRDFGYLARDLTPPEVEFRYELTTPSGDRWEVGPADGENRITGPAEDFCLLVTRRRHRADLALTADGAVADHWLDIAQAYRGPAGPGREAGQFAHQGR
ncbi:TIGR03084 family metal-binding protein [Actinomadura alba]|uniref:TIGR03084 family protein n=1 Tax=Actinomadura alba TaxID=406431 RepID=A0ABR7LRR5_9ACTN|nr:TIGR03084 family metal-binding protein [Actinomadura alba]MBC6467528.1 TIGR03084 family protein [Actinomadura alba]